MPSPAAAESLAVGSVYGVYRTEGSKKVGICLPAYWGQIDESVSAVV
jgi:hypothetical protein